jgi:enoyl-CoA hydratase/carnithine racemase
MNRDDLIRMARELGLITHVVVPEDVAEKIKHFAKLVATEEREACAKVCEEAHWSLDDRNEYAAAIRARGLSEQN